MHVLAELREESRIELLRALRDRERVLRSIANYDLAASNHVLYDRLWAELQLVKKAISRNEAAKEAEKNG